MIALDRMIFGSGKGLAMPHWNEAVYWLVDNSTKRGTFYTYLGGYGAQLHSYQWTHPKAQEERILAGVTFRPFSSYRSYGRVRVAWAMKGYEPTNEQLREFEARLGKNDIPWKPLNSTKHHE